MNDDQQFSPSESENNHGTPGRRGVAALWWLFLSLVVVVICLAVAAVILSRDGDEPAIEANQEQAGITAQITAGKPEEQSTEPAGAEPEGIEITPAEPTKPTTVPTINPTVEPTSIPTVEPTIPPTVEPTHTPTAEAAGSHPVAGEGTGRIAIVDNRSRLWTAAPDGSDQRLLSEPGRSYQFPSWSPVGNDIAVIGNDFGESAVFVFTDEEDSDVRQLYSDPVARPIYLYWSPVGENVSFIASHANGLALHMVPSNGLVGSQIVATSPSTFFWDWMPDGSQVLVHTGFTARDGDDTRLAFVPVDGGNQPGEISEDGYFQAPVVGANGRFFSYSDRDPIGNHWLIVRDIDQDQQVELIHHSGVVAMGFSPTRPQLAYTSPEIPDLSFYGPLNLIDLGGGDSRQLVPEEVMAFFWSPDGRSIAYFTLATLEAPPFNLEDAPVAGVIGQEMYVTGSGLPETVQKGVLARFRSQGDEETRIGLSVSIVDVDSGDTRTLISFEPSTVFSNQFLPFFDQYALSHRLWSPDSQSLVLPMENEQGRSSIVVVPVDGSEPLPIAQGVAAFWSQQ